MGSEEGAGKADTDLMDQAGEKYRIKFTDATYDVAIEDLGKATHEFWKSANDDVRCLLKTIDSLDTDVEVRTVRRGEYLYGPESKRRACDAGGERLYSRATETLAAQRRIC